MLPCIFVGVFEIKPKIKRRRRVRNSADRNAIDTTQCNASNCVESHAARSLKQNVRSASITPPHRFCKHRRIHVVKKNHVEHARFKRQQSIELIERINFAFNECDGSLCARSRRGCAHAFREIVAAETLKVIVLQEHCIKEPDAMERRTTTSRCVLLQRAKSRQRLARVANRRACSSCFIDETCGECRVPREQRREVQHRALVRE